MPHCIIEHSSTINGKELIPLVFQGALNTHLFGADGDDIKVRTQSFSDYKTGKTQSDFIHVVLKILSGRNADEKLKLSTLVLKEICSLNLNNCSMTVEVVDIDRSSYSKVVKK